jgi:hypothetical protein
MNPLGKATLFRM